MSERMVSDAFQQSLISSLEQSNIQAAISSSGERLLTSGSFHFNIES